MLQIPVNWQEQILVCYMLHDSFKYSRPKFTDRKGNSYKCIFNKVSRKNNFVYAFSAINSHFVSLVNPEKFFYLFFKPNKGLCWRKLIVNWPLLV